MLAAEATMRLPSISQSLSSLPPDALSPKILTSPTTLVEQMCELDAILSVEAFAGWKRGGSGGSLFLTDDGFDSYLHLLDSLNVQNKIQSYKFRDFIQKTQNHLANVSTTIAAQPPTPSSEHSQSSIAQSSLVGIATAETNSQAESEFATVVRASN